MSARWCLMFSTLLVASAVHAQEDSDCEQNGWWGRWRGGTAGHVCEVRELTLPANGALTVDACANGSIRVTGENRRDVQVSAAVQAWGRDEAEAQRIASAVNVRSDGTLRAEGPSQQGRAGWSVSFRVLTPHETDLSLQTQNGSISVTDVRGDLGFKAQNGSINLNGLAGTVRGRTTNGGVDAELTGKKWEGSGLDLETTNGGVRLRIPEDYSARLETATVNGGIDIDFPVTVTGRIGRELSTTLGDGGPVVRAETTNGGVRITRGRGDLTRLP
jgi:hypothetical protein